MFKKTLMAAAVFFLSTSVMQAQTATTYYVDGDNGNDTNACTAPDAACETLQAAFAKVVEGDTVKIAPSQNPYSESVIVPVGNLTIEGTGQKAGEVVLNQGLSNTVDNVTVRNLSILNQNDKAVLNGGNLTLEKVILTGNSNYCGGGIVSQKAVRSRGFPPTDKTILILKDSTVTDSTTQYNGAGVCARSNSTVHIVNSTLSGNNAVGSSDPANAAYSGMGGAVYVDGGEVYIYNSTLAGNEAANQGGALAVTPNLGYVLQVYNSLLADNTVNNQEESCQSVDNIQGGAYNLETGNSCADPGNTSLFPLHADPLLDVLKDNGGATPTRALLPGSPAIDAADPTGCKGMGNALLDFDQRGQQRVGPCDMGAFEYVPPGWTPPSPTTPGTTGPGVQPSASPTASVLPGATPPQVPQLTGQAAPGGEGGAGCSLGAGSKGMGNFWLAALSWLALGFLGWRRKTPAARVKS